LYRKLVLNLDKFQLWLKLMRYELELPAISRKTYSLWGYQEFVWLIALYTQIF